MMKMTKGKYGVFVFWLIAVFVTLNNITFASEVNNGTEVSGDAIITSVKGISKLERDNKTYTIKKNMKVQKDDIIVTSLKTTVLVKLDDSKEVTIGQLSNVKVVENKGDTVVIAVKNGTVINEVNKKIPADGKYEIMTPKLVASIRGTVCEVSSNSFEDTSNVAFLKGYGLVGSKDQTSKIALVQGQKTEALQDSNFTLQTINNKALNNTEIEYLQKNKIVKESLENKLADKTARLNEEHSLAFKMPNSQNEYPSEEFYTKSSNAELQIASIIFEQLAKTLNMSIEELKVQFGKNNITISDLASYPLMAEKLANNEISLKEVAQTIVNKKLSNDTSKDETKVEKTEVKSSKKVKSKPVVEEIITDNSSSEVEEPETETTEGETPEDVDYTINTAMVQSNVVGTVTAPLSEKALNEVVINIAYDNSNFIGFDDIYYTNKLGENVSIKDSLQVTDDKNISYSFIMPDENVELKVVAQTQVTDVKLNIVGGYNYVEDIIILPTGDMKTYQDTDTDNIKLIPNYREDGSLYGCKILTNSLSGTGLFYVATISYTDKVDGTSKNLAAVVSNDNVFFGLPNQYVNGKLIYDEIFVSIEQR